MLQPPLFQICYFRSSFYSPNAVVEALSVGTILLELLCVCWFVNWVFSVIGLLLTKPAIVLAVRGCVGLLIMLTLKINDDNIFWALVESERLFLLPCISLWEDNNTRYDLSMLCIVRPCLKASISIFHGQHEGGAASHRLPDLSSRIVCVLSDKHLISLD